MSKQISHQTLSKQLMSMTGISPEMREFLTDVVAVVHNNSIRTYEFSCILDGIMMSLQNELGLSETKLQNYVQIATAIKEYHMQTGKIINFEEAKELFLKPGFTIGDDKIRINVFEFLNAQTEGGVQ